MHTKAEILEHRLSEARAKVEKLESEIRGLQLTRCDLTCGKCGAHHETEWDFASHYVIPDTRFLNLGNCPIETHFHHIDGSDVECRRLTHCPSLCDCAVDMCDVAIRPEWSGWV